MRGMPPRASGRDASAGHARGSREGGCVVSVVRRRRSGRRTRALADAVYLRPLPPLVHLPGCICVVGTLPGAGSSEPGQAGSVYERERQQ